jgi:hypothetical protein
LALTNTVRAWRPFVMSGSKRISSFTSLSLAVMSLQLKPDTSPNRRLAQLLSSISYLLLAGYLRVFLYYENRSITTELVSVSLLVPWFASP